MMEVRNTANQRHVEAQTAKEYIPSVVTGTLRDTVTQRLKISAI